MFSNAPINSSIPANAMYPNASAQMMNTTMSSSTMSPYVASNVMDYRLPTSMMASEMYPITSTKTTDTTLPINMTYPSIPANAIHSKLSTKQMDTIIQPNMMDSTAMPPNKMDTILVKSLSSCPSQTQLNLYFCNKKIGGGEIKKLSVKGMHAFVTFADVKGTFMH